jgi:hypothetical protein
VRPRSRRSAVGGFIAAILGRIGYVGRPRRRSEIRHDLQLLDEVAESQHLGRESRGYATLKDRIEKDVMCLAGVKVEGDKTRPVGSIVFGLIFGIPAAYWTYWLVRDGFEWLALLPGTVAGFLLIATLSMLVLGVQAETASKPDEKTQPPTSPSSG